MNTRSTMGGSLLFLATVQHPWLFVLAATPNSFTEGDIVERGRDLFLSWIDASEIPGSYSTDVERAQARDHPADLTHSMLLHFGKGGLDQEFFDRGEPDWHRTTPNPVFSTDAARSSMLEAIAWLLRRGMSRLQDAVLDILKAAAAHEIDHVLTLSRAGLNSFEDFWRQVNWTVRYGPRQLEPDLPEHQDYGPETNFWLKFRPTLACHHMPRLGAELGGFKSWCNPHYWLSHGPKFVLSLGSGGDFQYENFVTEQWPDVTVVTADCTSIPEPGLRNFSEGRGKLITLPLCLRGVNDEYISFFSKEGREQFVTYPAFMRMLAENHSIDHFDVIKSNIEASEYPLFAHIMQNPEENLKRTSQIHLELHRMGMEENGLNFHSLLFAQLLLATFMSGGYHPVSFERWMDELSATDVVLVNQTWWLLSELDARRGIWTRRYPEPRLTEAIFP
ncbi:unnamed protein product, partial [Polarella glacialis]